MIAGFVCFNNELLTRNFKMLLIQITKISVKMINVCLYQEKFKVPLKSVTGNVFQTIALDIK